MPKQKKRIKIRDQEAEKDVKGGHRHKHHGVKATGSRRGDRPDPPGIRHL